MKEILSYLYKINVIDEFDFNNEKIFKTNNSNYLYKEIKNTSYILLINSITDLLNRYKFFSYKIKRNIYNEIISKYNDTTFVIVDIGESYNECVDLEDMLSFYSDSKNILIGKVKYKNNWNILWESKINYLSNHFSNNKVVNKNYEILFNYYISMAEVALQYLLAAEKKFHESTNISFVHRRIFIPNVKFNFYNPLNFIIDLEIRDICEYIKSLYYNNEDYIIDLDYYLKTHFLDEYLLSFLYARIIYPSNFFDDYESNNIDINKYIDFASYESFIKKIYEVISSYILIEPIEFLN